MPEHNSDPVFLAEHPSYEPPEKYDTISGFWYFWDETWSNLSEPFNTEEECRIALKKYVEEELYGKKS